jgi:hypothetical protein
MSGPGAMFQADVDKSWDVRDSLPVAPQAPTPAPSKWNGWSAPLRGVAAGVAEAFGAGADIAQGAAQVYAATPTGLDPFPKQTEAARQRMVTQGIDTNSEAGRSLRNVARDYRPDPQTAGVAEKIFFEIPRVVTKAAGYVATGGPIVGATNLAIDEGMTVSSDLAEQGVDEGTRVKVGVLAGAATGAGVLLPAAGTTIGKTVGLWALGGPGAFVAQQTATREILADANYTEISRQYDPLDPVGLALATLVPAGFGALAMRNAAKGVVTASRTADVARVSPEQVDATMTHNLSLAQDIREATPPAEAMRQIDEALATVEPQVAPRVARTPELVEAPPAVEAVDAAPAVARSADPELAALQQRAARVEAALADVPFRTTEDGKTVTVKQEMERIRREVAEGTDDDLGLNEVNLAQVAAECALSLGAG